MAKMLDGRNKILLLRKLGDDSKGAKLLFQTEHTFSYDRELEKIATKDGTVIKVGELESEVPINAIQAKDDPVVTMLQESVINADKLELWEVTVDEDLKENGKYPAVYAQGYLESWELPANVEDEAEISSTFQVELEPQFGMTSLSEEQEEAIQYAFIETDETQDKPRIPSDLTLTFVSDTTVDVSWGKVNNADTYSVYVDNELEEDGISTENHSITGLTAETIYKIEITAVNEHGESGKSTTIRVKTTA